MDRSSSRPTAGAAGLFDNLNRTFRLAWPVVMARAGVLVLVLVDTVMTGRAGGAELAYLAIGTAPALFLMLLGIGMLQGTAVLTAQADGAGDRQECGGVWQTSMAHAVVVGILFAITCLFGEAFLLATGQSPDLARGGGGVLLMMSWNMPAVLLYVATAAFLEGIGRPKIGMVILWVANLINIPLNWLVIYGHWGWPAMGAEGAIAATGLVRWLAFFVIVGYTMTMRDRGTYGIGSTRHDLRAMGIKLRRIGYPLSLAQGVESGAFTTLALFAGWLGATSLAGYQIAFNLFALIFMAAIGISTAGSVRVGNAVGRGDMPGVRLAGWNAVLLVILVMALFAAGFALFPEPLAALYTAEAEVAAVAAPALVAVAGFIVFDGTQAVLMGALRGTGDVWLPMLLQAISFWGLTVPVAAWAAFRLEWGVVGLLQGVFVGVVASSLVLAWRFRVVSNREIGRF